MCTNNSSTALDSLTPDLSPATKNGYSGHFSPLGKVYVGDQGRSIKHIIEDINKSTFEHYGELVVLDLSHELDRNTPKWKGFSDDVWLKLYAFWGRRLIIFGLRVGGFAGRFDDGAVIKVHTDGSKSVVLYRVPQWAPLPPPPPHPPSLNKILGVSHAHRFPHTGTYPDTQDPAFPASD